ncbi:hypothetical protein PHISCL_07001 [Aspergillus sclerotialis]|uniref:C2H2-type domain-containing protein n=1 Tax=Aspergillus sclerotialis TaxID=2070753 RepID=A0A3A2ZC24_9EURO|nr:hypothetical protein PHISCL_07001 [Aspergillus sclerotialis]
MNRRSATLPSRSRREEISHGLPAPPSEMVPPSLPPRPPSVKPHQYPEHDMPPGLNPGSLPPGGFLGPPRGFRLASLHPRYPATPRLMTAPPAPLPPRPDVSSLPHTPWVPHPGIPGVHPPCPGMTGPFGAPGATPYPGMTGPAGAPGAAAPFPSLPVPLPGQPPQLLVPLPREGGAPIHCSTCNCNFATMDALINHCRTTTKHHIEIGPHLTFNGQAYNCNLCRRFFDTRDALLMHLRNSTRHLWCERCKHVFPDAASMVSHLHSSSKHHICNTCGGRFDFEHEHEHIAHDIAVHNYCRECGYYFDTAELLQQHQIRGHTFYCEFCGAPFQSENQMLMHRATHLPRNLRCPGCPEMFRQFSAILKHIEDGRCASGYNELDVNEIARMFYRHHEYVTVEDNKGGWSFKCPGCSARLDYLSRVYQHAENTGSCKFLLSMHGCLSDLSHFIGGRIPWG